jgi:hypothetical protein
VDGNATITGATIHDNPVAGIYDESVTGTLKVCNNTFSGNGTDVYHANTPGAFDDCSSVKPPANPFVNATFVEDKENKGSVTGSAILPVNESLSEGDLPGSLPSGTTFVAGANITLHNAAGELVKEVPGGVQINMDIPADMQGKSIRVLFWNGTTWVEVSASISANGKQITFFANKAGSYVLVTP